MARVTVVLGSVSFFIFYYQCNSPRRDKQESSALQYEVFAMQLSQDVGRGCACDCDCFCLI